MAKLAGRVQRVTKFLRFLTWDDEPTSHLKGNKQSSMPTLFHFYGSTAVLIFDFWLS